MNERYIVELTAEERVTLTALVSGGSKLVRDAKRAQILLAADGGATDEAIAASVCVGTSTVYRTKRRLVEGGVENAIHDQPRPGARRKLTGREEALLVATACSKPPEGRARWTLELCGSRVGVHTGIARTCTPGSARRAHQDRRRAHRDRRRAHRDRRHVNAEIADMHTGIAAMNGGSGSRTRH